MTDQHFSITLDPAIGYKIADLIREFDSEDFALQGEDDLSEDIVDKDAPNTQQMTDPFEAELTGLIASLNIDAQRDLLALSWVGRGDYAARNWSDARRQARETMHLHVAQYLKETPLASDFLIEGLTQLGYPRPE